MEESSAAFQDRLQAAIQNKLAFIEEEIVSYMPDAVSNFHTSLKTFISALQNAGELAQNRFHTDSMPHDLNLPQDDPLTFETRNEEISFRLTEYIKRLEFLENNYILTPESLTIDRTGELIGFFRYIGWQRLSPTAMSPNERVLAELVQSVLNGDDNLSGGIVRDVLSQLSETADKIICGLEDILVYLKERYKLDIRNRVLPSVVIEPLLASGKSDEAMFLIKKAFRNEMGENPFYTDLAREIIDEDFSSESVILREDVIQRIMQNRSFLLNNSSLEIEETETDTALLFEGYRVLAAAGPSLIRIADKLIHNSNVVEDTKPGLFRRFIMFLLGRNIKNPDRVYSVVVFNSNRETGNKLKIDLNRFSEELKKEGKKLSAAGDETSELRSELEQLADTELLENLERHLKHIFRFQSIFPAVDKHLKDRADNAMRAMMNGIRLDMNNIQSCILKANSRRQEYRAQQSAGF